MHKNFESFHPSKILNRNDEERPRQSVSQQELRSPFFQQSLEFTKHSESLFKGPDLSNQMNFGTQSTIGQSPLNSTQKAPQKLFNQRAYLSKGYKQDILITNYDSKRSNQKNTHSLYTKATSQNGSLDHFKQYQNSKSYNLDDSQVRLTQINQRMQLLKERRISPDQPPIHSQLQQDIIKREGMIEKLQQENELLRNAVHTYLTKNQLFPILEQFQEIQHLNEVDLYTLAANTRHELLNLSERQVKALKEQILQSINKINEQDQERQSLKQRVLAIQQQYHDSEKSRDVSEKSIQDLEYRNECLLGENERMQKQYRSYRDSLENRQIEENYHSIQSSTRVPLKSRENQNTQIQIIEHSERKLLELHTQLGGLSEKVKKDESTIKQLQDINFKLSLELDEKNGLDMKIHALTNQNHDLQNELKDLKHQVEETRNRGEKERDAKQQEFKQVFEELSKYRSESRILKDDNSWLQNQKAALEEQYQKTIEMYNEVLNQRKILLDEKEELLLGFDDVQEQHNIIVEQLGVKFLEEYNNQKSQHESIIKIQGENVCDIENQLKKYKKTIFQLHEMLNHPTNKSQEQTARYESLNHLTILENLEGTIANMLYSMRASVELQENLKCQEEERSQVIYDMQNQIADMNQQYEHFKQANSQLDKQNKLMKVEYKKIKIFNKTVIKECKHQKQVSEQYLQDLNSKNDAWQKIQAKLKEQFEYIITLENQKVNSNHQLSYNNLAPSLTTSKQHNTENFQMQNQVQDLKNRVTNILNVFPPEVQDAAQDYLNSTTQSLRCLEKAVMNCQQQQDISKYNEMHAQEIKGLKNELVFKQHNLNNLQIAYDDINNDYKRVCKETYVKMKTIPYNF